MLSYNSNGHGIILSFFFDAYSNKHIAIDVLYPIWETVKKTP